MRGMLSFLMLYLVGQRPSSGQDLAQELGKRKGTRPKPGTIYPALKKMSAAGLIEGKREGRAIVYSLTEKGKGELGLALRHFRKVFGDIL